LEGLFEAADPAERSKIEALIRRILLDSEIDLGIEWHDGQFIRRGAALLDEKLVNNVLHWLREAKYQAILNPYEKGLGHLLQSFKKPAVLPDVVTDVYEALEALSKIVTERPDRDLSSNREVFISKVKASEAYRTLLKDYIEYANLFRHAETPTKPRPAITEREAESFVYLTGVFIRLALP
jgi:hypothetical protein